MPNINAASGENQTSPSSRMPTQSQTMPSNQSQSNIVLAGTASPGPGIYSYGDYGYVKAQNISNPVEARNAIVNHLQQTGKWGQQLGQEHYQLLNQMRQKLATEGKAVLVDPQTKQLVIGIQRFKDKNGKDVYAVLTPYGEAIDWDKPVKSLEEAFTPQQQQTQRITQGGPSYPFNQQYDPYYYQRSWYYSHMNPYMAWYQMNPYFVAGYGVGYGYWR